MSSLLAQHALEDRVAFGALGERTAADLLRDAGAVAHALPEPVRESKVLVGVRRDRYAFAAALIGAWARGHEVVLPAVDVTREGFLQLAQQPGVVSVVHDTLSSAALPIARILEEARPEHALSSRQLSGEHVLHLFGRYERQASRTVRSSELLAETHALAVAAELPTGASCFPTISPETRFGLCLGVLWPLASGGAFLRAHDTLGSLFAHAPQPSAARVLITVPAQLRAMLRSPEAPLPQATHVICGATPLVDAAFAALPAERVRDVYASERLGLLGVRTRADAAFEPLRGEPVTSAERWSGLEERVAWLDGVIDAALLPAEAHSACRLALQVEAGATEDALRQQIRRAVPGLSISEWRIIRPDRTPASPAGVVSFSGGVRGLQRDRAGRHDRLGLLRLFGLSADGEPLSQTLRLGASYERDGKHVTAIDVPEGYVYFAGHFPGYPILPGAAQLSEMVLRCVRRARPELGRLVRMARVKFQERIMPGDHIEVVLTFPADPKQLDFSLLRAGMVCAAGRLSFELNQTEEPA